MALLSVAFESTAKLGKNKYVFEYEGYIFKVIKGTREWKELLYADINVRHGDNTLDEYWKAMSIVHKLFSLVVWCHKVPIFEGGNIVSGAVTSHSLKIKRNYKELREVHQYSYGLDFDYIPIITNNVQLLALAWYKDAKASASRFYKAFTYHKIIELERRFKRDPDKWIENNWSFAYYPGLAKSWGTKNPKEFFRNDVRNAIAHITKPPYLNPDKSHDVYKINGAVRLLEGLAERYIEIVLGVGRYRDKIIPLAPIKL